MVSVSLFLHYVFFINRKCDNVKDKLILSLLLVSKLRVWLQMSMSGFPGD